MPTHARNQPRRRVLMLGIRMAEVTVYTDNFCHGFAERHNIAVCSYFSRESGFPDGVACYPGDGTPWGFARALAHAIETHRPELVHSHYPHLTVLYSLLRKWCGHGDQTPLVQTVQNDYGNYSRRNQLFWRFAYPAADRVVHCGAASLESFPDGLIRRAKTQPEVICNAVDLEFVDRCTAGESTATRQPGEPLKVGCVGRLITCKNVELLLRAAARLPAGKIEVTLLGDGNQHAILTDLVKQLGVDDRVYFAGRVGLADVYRCVAGLDLVVQPSRAEGLPRSVLEAMGCRRPVLLSDIGPHREIADGTPIPLFGVDDDARLAKLLGEYADLSPAKIRSLGNACRAVVERRFSVAHMHDLYSDVYESALGGQTIERIADQDAVTIASDAA